MPIKKCTLKSGGQGWKWGDKGKCYPLKSQAEKQAKAAYASGYKKDTPIKKAKFGSIIAWK